MTEQQMQALINETQDEKTNRLLQALTSQDGELPSLEELEWFFDRIKLLQRQAVKASNKRKALRRLNTAHRTAILENRWLSEAVRLEFPDIWKRFASRVREGLFVKEAENGSQE